MTLNITDLIIASLPMILSIVGIYVKMNNLVIRQDERIEALRREVREEKRKSEKHRDKMFIALEEIKKEVVHIKIHFGACANFKQNGK